MRFHGNRRGVARKARRSKCVGRTRRRPAVLDRRAEQRPANCCNNERRFYTDPRGYYTRRRTDAGDRPVVNTRKGFDIQGNLRVDVVFGARVPDAGTLLEEQFQLKSHRETREQPGYELVADSRGAKLAPAGEGRSKMKFGDLEDPKMTLDSLCQIIEFDVARPVINKTGLSGSYAIKLQWASDRTPKGDGAAAHGLPSLFTAIRETLGLKLENARVPVEVMVIESVERPADN